MKNIHNILQRKSASFFGFFLALPLLFLASGCKDKLDITPSSEYTSENFYLNEGQAEMAVLGIYEKMASAEIWGDKLSTKYCVDTDEAQVSGSDNATDRRGIARYLEVATNTELPDAYIALYAGIERANICIDRIPSMDLYKTGTTTQKTNLKKLYGEALALRAMFYFDLIRTWGDVSFTTTPSKAGDDFNLPRTSRDTIYDHIIADLVLAADLVPWQSELTVQERLSKNAVKGILARICLSAAGYSLRWNLADGSNLSMRQRDDAARIKELYNIARTHTLDVINQGENSLNSSFKQVFRNYSSGILEPKESMFELGMLTYNSTNSSGTAVVSGGGQIGNYNGMEIADGALFASGVRALNGMLSLASYYYSFDSLDSRKYVTCNYQKLTLPSSRKAGAGYANRECQRLQSLSVGKWRMDFMDLTKMPMIDTRKTSINWVMLRYSDVLLMFAEADCQYNGAPSAEAINNLAEVRKRAFGVAPYGSNPESVIGTIPTDYDGFMNAIVNERSWELGHEGWRKTDLIRWNLLGTKLQSTRDEMYKLALKQGKYSWLPDTVWYAANEINISSVVDTFKIYYKKTTTAKSSALWRIDYKVDSKTGKQDKIDQIGRSFESNKDELYPIAQSILDVNPKLTQHPSFR